MKKFKQTLYHPVIKLTKLPIHELFWDVCQLHRKLASSINKSIIGTTKSKKSAFFGIGDQLYVQSDTGRNSGTISAVDPDPESLITMYGVELEDSSISTHSPEELWPVQEQGAHRRLTLLQHEFYLWHLKLGHTK